MITTYYRPQTLEEALALLSQKDTLPLGGGTALAQQKDRDFAVVDLQGLGLDKITPRGKQLEIGATVRLQQLLEVADLPAALANALRHEAPLNLRNMATVAGALVACDGRSPFAAAMLALDAQLTIVRDSSSTVPLGELLPLRLERLPGALITAVSIPLNVALAYEYVARTPDDLPIVCAAVAQWPSGRTRVVLGGYGDSPLMAMDGPTADGAEIAAREAYSEAGDEFASAEYRSEMAAVLVKRCLERVIG